MCWQNAVICLKHLSDTFSLISLSSPLGHLLPHLQDPGLVTKWLWRGGKEGQGRRRLHRRDQAAPGAWDFWWAPLAPWGNQQPNPPSPWAALPRTHPTCPASWVGASRIQQIHHGQDGSHITVQYGTAVLPDVGLTPKAWGLLCLKVLQDKLAFTVPGSE